MTALPIGLTEFEKPTKDRPFTRWEFLGIPLVRKAGLVTIFEKGAFFGSPRDAVAYANRPRNKKKFGTLMGFIFGEVIWGDPRMNFMFFQEDERARKRKERIKISKHLKNRGIRVWQYEKYLKANPLERYFAGKPPKRLPTEEERKAHIEKRLERMKKRDARKRQEEG